MNKEEQKEELVFDKDIVIIYHAYCYDGLYSAYIAKLFFGDSANYVPMKRGETLPINLINKEVYILDYAWKKEDMDTLVKVNKKVVVIDHHISSEKDITSATESIFDINHSGAYLTWKYFNKEKEVPLLISYISESDINKHTLQNSEEIDAYIHSLPFTFDSAEETFKNFDKNINDYIEKGELLISYREKILSPTKDAISFINFEGVKMVAVNTTLPMEERSFVAVELYTQYKCPVLIYRYEDGLWKCSLRSDGVTFDCTKIAEKYGGGGHKGAAGFSIKTDFPFSLAEIIS